MFLKCRRRKSRVIMLMMTTQLFQEKATDINIFCDTEFKASINHHRLMHLHKKRLIRNNIGTKNWMFTGRAGQWLEAFSELLIFKLGFTSLYCLHTWTLTGQILHYQTGNIEYTRHILHPAHRIVTWGLLYKGAVSTFLSFLWIFKNP